MGGGVTRKLPIAMAIAVFLATAIPAVAGKATHRPAANPVGIFNIDFSPKTLPKAEPIPIRFVAVAKFNFFAEHPPPLKGLLLKLDRHVRLGVKEIPSVRDVPGCLTGSGPRRRVGEMRKACGPAVIGSGRIGVEVRFPDRAPLPLQSELLVLNGGLKDGRAKLHVYSYLSAPVTGVFLATMEIKKIREGRYGFEALARVPKIAGGNGSITSLALSLKRGVLLAACPDGRLDFDSKATFTDGTGLGQPIVRTCASEPAGR